MKLELLPRTELTVRLLQALASGPSVQTGAELAAAVGSTGQYVPHVLRPLVAAGWVASARGPNGGYRLIRDDLTMLDVIEAVEGATDDGACVLRRAPCKVVGTCALHEAWTRARAALISELAATRALVHQE